MAIITGTNFNDNLNGTIFSDTIYGRGGSDRLFGGLGNDVLYGDRERLVVLPPVIRLPIPRPPLPVPPTPILPLQVAPSNNVPNINLPIIPLIGNNDYLDGGLGADTMYGDQGNDTYVVDNPGDRVIEVAGQGIDTVLSSINYTLTPNVENLTLTGSAISGVGNALNNTIIGNSLSNRLAGLDGNDFIDGRLGADIMSGGRGNDTFVVDNFGDRVIEGLGEGTDLVLSSVSHTLGANVENLTLTGFAFSGVGNSLNNFIQGNNVSNFLEGKAGDDRLLGEGGNDRLIGGTGRDVLFGGTGNDILIGADPAAVNPGRGEIDILFGGTGRDTFVLGTSTKTFYDDGNLFTNGTSDYALVRDFTDGQDTIQLKGGVNYRLASVSVGSVSGVGIYIDQPLFFPDELVGIVQGASLASLNITNRPAGGITTIS